VGDESPNSLAAQQWPELVRKIRERTPARLLVGRVGAAYRTATQMELREAHAAARDAVRNQLNLERDFTPDFVRQWKLFEVSSEAQSKDEFLLRPGLGRRFDQAARVQLVEHCSMGTDLQIAIGDGLSVSAVSKQIPSLLPLLHEGAAAQGWRIGQTFVIRHCRVGILNEIGEILNPNVAVLLIGERPGLATAESLSAYMAFRPRKSNTDADRNLISNIHARGIMVKDAATRILNLAAQMIHAKMSGCNLREDLPALGKG
jgi:ethanolamine ammonia-lyase small subunit